MYIVVMFLFETETSRYYIACQPMQVIVRQLPSRSKTKRARYVLDIGRSNPERRTTSFTFDVLSEGESITSIREILYKVIHIFY